jgi:integrase
MGRKSITGGVTAKGRGRIQFTFKLEAARYRPTLPIVPTEANLRRARQQLERIKRSIANGTFSFAEEFPDFRNLKKVAAAGCPRTCGEVFDLFLTYCGCAVPKRSSVQARLSGHRFA